MSDDREELDTVELPSTEKTSRLAECGQSIGPYRLLKKLGEGGMGEVWEAEQKRPVRRHVALKLIKRGMSTDRVVARFEAERQALALMNHPNVAKVFDAGATPDGRPYFAMELVEGIPIADHCDRQRLNTHQRLALFLEVCAGVQHAHQKGIIHRDIKSSNVLVQVQDAESVPKIIDFGVAKATQQRLTERTLYTELGQVIGTPEYMSPEQAALTVEDVDTRTDVYSLGVLLYQLLVGALPFDSRGVRRAGFDEIRRRIREEEPSRPSARLRTLGDASIEAAQRRHTDLAVLRRQLSGDLDWITMKAMEKDRTRRYGSPTELAADIRRHLEHEPVLAGAPSTAYRLKKFVRRHRFGVATAGALLLTLVAGLAAATYGMFRATRAESEARREAATAEQALEFLVGLFRTADPTGSRGGEIPVREILDEGAARISRELHDEPLVRARLMTTIGDVYYWIGELDQASSLAQESMEIRRNTFGDDHPDDADSLMVLANVAFRRRDLEVARSYAEQVLAIRERTLDALHPDLAKSLNSLANLMVLMGEPEQARPLMERTLAINERTLDETNAGSENSLDWLAMADPSFKGALSLLERDLEIREKALGPDHPEVARVLGALGSLMAASGDTEAARSLLQRALAINEKSLGPDHYQVGITFYRLGRLLLQTKEYAAARALLERSLSIWEQRLAPDHPFAHGTRWMIVHLLIESEEYQAALDTLERILSGYENRFAPDHPLVKQIRWLTGLTQMTYGERSRAEDLIRQGLAAAKTEFGKDSPQVQRMSAEVAYSTACRHARAGDREAALHALERAVDLDYNHPEDAETIATDPNLRPLHGHPEFEALVERARQNEVSEREE